MARQKSLWTIFPWSLFGWRWFFPLYSSKLIPLFFPRFDIDQRNWDYQAQAGACSATSDCHHQQCTKYKQIQTHNPFWSKKMFLTEVFTSKHISEKPKAENYQANACLVSCPATAGCQLKHYQHTDNDLCGWAPSPPPPQVWLLHNPLWDINIYACKHSDLWQMESKGGGSKHDYFTIHNK